ncbi:energy-coupling factor ABC transporter permease [Streptomyces sp. NPDC046215]|uniref:energy-coupling factor ABC transporter permease n=1 Tax=Streptomyces sp. NPDC046215 TaxID=3155774 RepID=UPI0033D37673
MHVPDGFIDAPVSVAAGAAAAAAVAVALRGARRELGGVCAASSPAPASADRVAPLAGLVAAFVFAVQMLNFPVAAGTSGHLLGGALAAVLVGPYTGVLCISVVLLMQGLLFADGGLTALGVNITVMGVVTTLVAYGVFRALVAVLPRRGPAVTAASFVAALVSVPAAACAFTLIYALGGTTDVPLGKVFAAMVGVHTLIGFGEAVITALTVSAVLAVRPDLVHGARGMSAPLELRTARRAPGAGPSAPRSPAGSLAALERDAPLAGLVKGATAPGPGPWQGPPAPPAGKAPRSVRRLWLAGLAAALLCAGGVSYYASTSPDGLEKVAHDKGLDSKEEEHAAKGSPLADYQVKDVADERISGGLAGVIGVGATLAAGTGVFVVVRRRRTRAAAPEKAPATGTA